MLQILGGNQAALRRHLMDMAKAASRMIVIVPEQYTLQTERDLMAGLDAPGFFDLEVLSPSRLTERVFAQAGSDASVRIDARGKQLALAKALLQCKKKLKYYESAAEKQGFIERAGALIADFKRAGVTPEALALHADTLPEEASRDKMQDLALLYAAYQALLSGQFVDGEDVLEAMLLRLPDSGIARDAAVAVYGFDVLTGQMNRLLLTLAQQSGDVRALIVMEDTEPFAPVLDSVRRLKAAARKEAVPCEMRFLPLEEEGRSAALSHLSRQYLQAPGEPYSGIVSSIRLYAAPNPYFEAHFAAQEMLLLHEKGVAFGEMAVIMGDAGFASTLSTVLASYRIPAYVSRKLHAASHGAARYLLASLRAVAEGYPAAAMLNIVKSGYAPILEEDAWQLENYVISYGIKGKLWLAPFQRGSEDERVRLEDARRALIEPLEALRKALKTSETASASLRAVYDFLTETEVELRLTENEERLMQCGMAAEALQNSQVWDAMMQLLSQAHALLGEERVTAHQLASWLEAGLEACELKSLPPAADAVICGEIGSLPLTRPRALWMMNLTDGLLSGGSSALLTAQEQEDAQNAMGVYLYANEDSQDALDQLDVWKALSAPSEYLYLTRAQATQEGAALRPFSSLAHIRRLFPALVEEGGVSQQCAAALPLAPGPALDALGAKARGQALTGSWLEAWKYLNQCPETAARAQALRRAFDPEPTPPPLPREVIHALFMERVMSVSRLESFAACPYRHFVEHGLSPKPRKEWTITPMDTGNFYHSALEGFTRLLPQIPNWPRIDKKTCDAAMDQAAEPLFQQMLSGVMGDSARMRALGEKYRRVLRRVAWTFTRGAKQSDFTAKGAEVKFGYPDGLPPIELTLSDGSRVFVRGIIDRIDRYAGDEGVYLRVVDYKSGAKKLDPARIFWGEQLQLLLYLKAALSVEDGAEPAGAFYMHLFDPLLPDQPDTAQVEDALARELCLRGVALRDAAILRHMDAGEPPLTLPKVLKADGDFAKTAMLASLEELKNLIQHAMTTAGQLAEKMLSGHIAADPLCDKRQKGPCDYCDYAGICRRKAAQGPGQTPKLQDMSLETLLDIVGKNNTGNSAQDHV